MYGVKYALIMLHSYREEMQLTHIEVTMVVWPLLTS